MNKRRVDVYVHEGKLIGIVEECAYGGNYVAFRGIPYAKPPVDELRFKDPVPPEPWSGGRDASKHGNISIQMDLFTQKMIGDEDCLYLNVYTTNIDSEKKHPVMVWIHGGVFRSGSGDAAIYGPDHIVKKEIVLVTLNYRLGVLGFLNLYDKVVTGNQGLKDVIMALQWVQKNISNFGGDPKNVTIFGASAGAAIVHYLALSPLSESGLFHKVISQSGAATNPWALTEQEPPLTNKGFQLAEKLGKTTTDAKVAYEFLKTIDAKKLVQTEQQDLLNEVERQQFLLPFTPSMDELSENPFFLEPQKTLVNRGVKIPFLIGYTEDEGIFFLSEYLGLSKKESLKRVNSDFKMAIYPRVLSKLSEIPITVEELRSLYFGDKAVSEETLKTYANFIGDQGFYQGIIETVDIQIKSGHNLTYLYNLSYENEACFMRKLMNIKLPGVAHGEELFYLFYPHMMKDLGLLPPESNSEVYTVISRCVQMWTDFAKTGNPTPTITDLIPVKWEPLKNGDTYNYLNIDSELRMKTLHKKEQRWDWKNMKMKLQNSTSYEK